jgi:alanyl-tRNA synthetase
VLKGQRVLGHQDLFLYQVYQGVVDAMGHHYTELRERRDVIIETLRNEEALFRRTLNSGSAVLLEHIEAMQRSAGGVKTLEGATAFRLYDTFGFPLEVTQELAEEAGLGVDVQGYEIAMTEAQERSRAVGAGDTVYGGVSVTFEFGREPTPTEFTGYIETETEASIVGALHLPPQEGQAAMVVALDRTPFYAQSGGQVSDTGRIVGDGFELAVTDVAREQGVYAHMVTPRGPIPPLEELTGKRVRAEVDVDRRNGIRRNHTATHLLHAALRQVLGHHVTQAGSYVGPDRLRFDFTHGKAMSAEEVAAIEEIVNARILENRPVVTYVDIPVNDAKSMGAMALFGEKYSNLVRVVQVGAEPEDCPSFSRELCGGTHVRATGEIGLFKVASESSAASGIRRIEGLTGQGSYEWVRSLSAELQQASVLLKVNPREVPHAISHLQQALAEERKKRERAERASMQKGLGSDSPGAGSDLNPVGPVSLWTAKYEDIDQKVVAGAIDEAVNGSPNLIALAALRTDGRVTFICKVGPEAITKGAHAGNLVREVAKIAGGGGGGRADFATAGGKRPEMVDEALAAAPKLLAEMVASA